jgi:hypothetical protein
LLDTLAHCYTPHCTPGPSPYAYKRKVEGSRTRRLAARENGPTRKARSPTRTLVTPYCKRTRPGRRATRRPRVSPFVCSFPPSCSASRRPIWAGARGDNSLVGLGTARGRNADTWGRARWSFLCRPRLDLAAVDLTLASGTTVGAGQAALYSCQVGQWSGEVTAVTSALSTEERASG